MIRAVIIEDEDFAVQRLQMMLSDSGEEVEVIAVLSGVQQAVKWLSANKADLVFLDIHLADGNAFKIFEQVEVRTPIIFTTAYHDYALRAFEQHSIDYLLKPVNREKLRNSLNKLKTLQGTGGQGLSSQNLEGLLHMLRPPKPKRFLIQLGNKVRVVELPDIAYFHSNERITFAVTTAEGKNLPIEPSLKKLEDSLPGNDFFRVNRRYLLSRQSIRELYYLSTSRVQVLLNPETKEKVIVSRERLGQFKKWLLESE